MISPIFKKVIYLLIFLSVIACTEKTSLEKAENIALRIIDETQFDTEKVEVQPIDNIQVIDFNLVFGENIDGIYLSKNNVSSTKDTTVYCGISFSIPLVIEFNDEIIYQQFEDKEFNFRERAYGMYAFQDTFKLKVNKGNNEFLIKAVCDNNSKIYLREINYGTNPILKFGKDKNAFNWLYSEVNNSIKSIMPKKVLTQTSNGLNSLKWKKYPDLLYDKLLIDDDNTYKRESYIEWHYAIGTTLLGMINLNQELNNSVIDKFIKGYCDYNLEMRDTFREQYNTKHALRVASYRNLRKAMLDDAGPATIPYAYLYQKTKDDKYLPIIWEMTDYILNDQSRLEDNTFCRPEPVENTIWADDLFMSCQLLLRAYQISNDTKYIDEVVRQIINFDKYLWDKSKELYKHARIGDSEERSEIYWSRANGWISWTLSDALIIIPREHGKYETVMNIYRKVMQGIINYQSDSGLWHQVLDREDSFKETSSSAMFTLAIARGVLNGWLSDEFKKYAVNGWNDISGNISNDGIVKDICRGTGIGHTFKFYNSRQRFDNDPRGLGAVLTAAVEVNKLIK